MKKFSDITGELWADDLWKWVQRIHKEHRGVFPMMTIFIRELLKKERASAHADGVRETEDRIGKGAKARVWYQRGHEDGTREERKKILTDIALMGKTIPKYDSQGWTHWIDEYVRKGGIDPVEIRKK